MSFAHFVAEQPSSLRANATRFLDHVQESDSYKSLSDDFKAKLTRACALSPFVAEFISKYPEVLVDWQSPDSALFLGRSENLMTQLLAQKLDECNDEAQAMAMLRVFRNTEQARIIWRDMNGLGNLDQTLAEASALADVCIQQCLIWLHARFIARYGTPRNADGEEQRMIVLGMGKLGARELNVSSDIDLIFAFPEKGETDHSKKPIDNHQFFSKLGQKLIHMLDAQTAEGFVFRVDMRLRPYGSSGALALNLRGFEDYFQTQGREWERFAMLKARAITGTKNDRSVLLKSIIQPFVYRKYPDYSSFQALRDMKRLIMSEVHRKGGDRNIKLGSGGIREIEFIAQAAQLIYGGRDLRLQDTGLQSAYRTLAEQDYLPNEWVERLLEAYCYLRDLEHAIQGYKDQQTQQLPDEEAAQDAVVLAMNEESWDALVARQAKLRANVSAIFEEFLQEDAQSEEHEDAGAYEWLQIWQVDDDEQGSRMEAWAKEFEQAGYDDPVLAAQAMVQFKDLPRFRSMTPAAYKRFEEFLPRLLNTLAVGEAPSLTLKRVLKVVQAVLGRSIYLVLLIENEQALQQLCKLCSESEWFAEHISATPVVLDDLLKPELLYTPPKREELSDELRQSLLRIPEEDLEAQMDCLRNFKQSHMLRVAAAEISGVLPVMKVSDYLTWLAEACVDSALSIALHNLSQKHGFPEGDELEGGYSGFAVVGYGKLGGIELGYSSDLDMVFIYDANDFGSTDGDKPINNQLFYTRLGQRLVHILGAQTSQGICYEVDMRLRPSGNSGMLVSSIKAFEKYQREDAWTWEHQALVRARCVAGDERVMAKFDAVRDAILSMPRERAKLLEEVRVMREKMHTAAADKLGSIDMAEKNIKQGRGGLIDIEFLTQFLVLANAHEHPSLTVWSDNVRLLEALSSTIDEKLSYQALDDAYRTLRSALHRKSLSGVSYPEGLKEFPAERDVAHDAFVKIFG